MVAVSLVIGALVLLGSVGIAMYGAVTLPSDARVPLHSGVRGYDNFVSKTAGLILWPAIGGFIYGINVAVLVILTKANSQASGSPVLLIMPITLAVVCAVEWGAISIARSNATTRSE